MQGEVDIIPSGEFNDKDVFSANLEGAIKHATRHGRETSTLMEIHVTNSRTVVQVKQNGYIRWKQELMYDFFEVPDGKWLARNVVGKCIAIPHETFRMVLDCTRKINGEPGFWKEQGEEIASALKKNISVKAVHIATLHEGMFSRYAWKLILSEIGKMDSVETLSIYGKPLMGQWTFDLIDPEMAAIKIHRPVKKRPLCFFEQADAANKVAEGIIVHAVMPNKSITSLCFRNMGVDDRTVDFLLANVVNQLTNIRLAVNNITYASIGKLKRAIKVHPMLTSCLLTHNLLSKASQAQVNFACTNNRRMQRHMEMLIEKNEIARLLAPVRFFHFALSPVISQPTHVFNLLRKVDFCCMQIGPAPMSENKKSNTEQEKTQAKRKAVLSKLPSRRRPRPRIK